MTDPSLAGAIVGVGGIGSGLALQLLGDRTLGREESRAVELLPGRDYCKLHIVLHYVQRLLGDRLPVIPIGAVGDDEPGRRLLAEFAEVGLSTACVRVDAASPTLSAISFLYPNGDGGNLTFADSASDGVSLGDVRAGLSVAVAEAGARAGLVVALPEVPMPARAALLRGAPDGWLRVASFVTAEVAEIDDGWLGSIDLIVLNLDEARAFAALPDATPDAVLASLSDAHPNLHLAITAGAEGSWTWDGSTVSHVRLVAPIVRSTAGAGDAYLSGVLVGLACGMPLHEAGRVGAVVASIKVGSIHAIHPELDADSVRAAAASAGVKIPEQLR